MRGPPILTVHAPSGLHDVHCLMDIVVDSNTHNASVMYKVRCPTWRGGLATD